MPSGAAIPDATDPLGQVTASSFDGVQIRFVTPELRREEEEG